MASEKIKVNLTSGAVASAIDNDVKAQIAEGKSVLARYRPYIKLVADGYATPDSARPILLKVREKMIAHRRSVKDARPVAVVQDSRVSELKSILRLGEWKCWPTVIGYFDGHDMNFDDLLQVSKFIRSTIKGDAKKNANAAPAKDRVMRAIKVRKVQRRGATTRSPVANVSNPETAATSIKRQAKGLLKWFGKDRAEGARFIDAILKAVANVESAAKKVVKAREAETAAA